MVDAYNHQGESITAAWVSANEWDAMKEVSKRDANAFKLACCGERAIPKTSINGVQFFAHMAGVCATAPETQWHIDGKDIIAGCLRDHGIPFQLERPSSSGRRKWIADIYAEIGQRQVVIELQRSYQHYRDYLRRQQRYQESGIEAYWLTRQEFFLALAKSINRAANRAGGAEKIIQGSPDVPIGILNLDASPKVFFPGEPLTVNEWISRLVLRPMRYENDHWTSMA